MKHVEENICGTDSQSRTKKQLRNRSEIFIAMTKSRYER